MKWGEFTAHETDKQVAENKWVRCDWKNSLIHYSDKLTYSSETLAIDFQYFHMGL